MKYFVLSFLLLGTAGISWASDGQEVDEENSYLDISGLEESNELAELLGDERERRSIPDLTRNIFKLSNNAARKVIKLDDVSLDIPSVGTLNAMNGRMPTPAFSVQDVSLKEDGQKVLFLSLSAPTELIYHYKVRNPKHPNKNLRGILRLSPNSPITVDITLLQSTPQDPKSPCPLSVEKLNIIVDNERKINTTGLGDFTSLIQPTIESTFLTNYKDLISKVFNRRLTNLYEQFIKKFC